MGGVGGEYTMLKKEMFLLSKYMGRLGIIDLQTVVKVKHVKWMIEVLKAGKNKYWGVLATKYSECLDRDFFPIKMFPYGLMNIQTWWTKCDLRGCNIGHPSDTHIELKASEIWFVHNIRFKCPIVLKFCTAHGSDIAMWEFHSDWTTLEARVIDKRDFARFGFKIRVGRISHIVQRPILYGAHTEYTRVI